MSHLLKLVYEASELRRRYTGIHEEMFGFSVRRIIRFGQQSERECQAKMQRLDDLSEALAGMRKQIADLQECDLTKRRGHDICTALGDYTQALSDSVALLHTICQRLAREQKGVDGWRNYTATELRQDRITYDDAIQHHKRMGRRLQELLSTF
jgi:hypothetical protein